VYAEPLTLRVLVDSSWSTFLGGLGLGSAVVVLIQHILARRAKATDTLLAERKEAFAGYLAAMATLTMQPYTHEAASAYALWVARVQLVASKPVVDAVEGLKASEAGSPERARRLDELLRLMREDLGLATDS
jgi:hypothetical protein